jgi:hypothetical protein
MPSPFDITTASNTVALDNKREGVAVFTVKNNLRRRIRAQARVTTQPADAAKWLTILPADATSSDPANVRDFPIDATQQIQIKVAVPADAPPASYTLKLTVADESNPDDLFTDSPDVVFTVKETPKPAPTPIPSWIIPAVLIGVAVIVVIILGGVALSNRQQTTPTPSTPCVAKLKAPQRVYTQPDNDPSHLLDQLQIGAQIAPTSKSADGKWWGFTLFNVDAWADTAEFTTTADVSGNCDAIPVICLLTITADQFLSSKPNPDPNFQIIQALAGYQYRPIGRLPDNSWWQVYTQMAWVPTNMLNQTVKSSGDCSKLPIVSG